MDGSSTTLNSTPLCVRSETCDRGQKTPSLTSCTACVSVSSWSSADLALIAEAAENDIRRERQLDAINKAKAAASVRSKPILTLPVIEKVKALREHGATVPEIMRCNKLSKASVYRALEERVNEVKWVPCETRRVAKFEGGSCFYFFDLGAFVLQTC